MGRRVKNQVEVKDSFGLPTIEQKIEFQEEAQEEGAHKIKRLGAWKEKMVNK